MTAGGLVPAHGERVGRPSEIRGSGDDVAVFIPDGGREGRGVWLVLETSGGALVGRALPYRPSWPVLWRRDGAPPAPARYGEPTRGAVVAEALAAEPKVRSVTEMLTRVGDALLGRQVRP